MFDFSGMNRPVCEASSGTDAHSSVEASSRRRASRRAHHEIEGHCFCCVFYRRAAFERNNPASSSVARVSNMRASVLSVFFLDVSKRDAARLPKLFG